MAPVPKKKHTRSRSNKRRNSASNKKVISGLSKCPSCGKLRESHRTCPHCGFYRN